ncbi:MAG: penicillin-binding protein 2 [Clostridia bacterium]|nr:penicillin-binding protein 2 [Clostridia bacterium]
MEAPEGERPWAARARRVMALALVVAFALVARLAQLQIQEGAVWAQAARDQIVRELTLPAPRGRILDAHGAVLASDRPAWTAYLVYSSRPMDQDGVELLARILSLDPADVRRALEALEPSANHRPFEPVPLKFDLSPVEQVEIAENLDRLPGVLVRAVPIRTYLGLADAPDLGSSLAAHVLGYVYPGGKTGIEKTYDGPIETPSGPVLGLAGKDGIERVEVDYRGRPVLGEPVYTEPPVPGNDVRLTIDAELQAVAERALRQRMQYLRSTVTTSGVHPAANIGAVVVMDVKTGAILADVSEPTFDPNVFAKTAGYTPESPGWKDFEAAYRAYTADPALGTLTNHTLAYRGPIGSTFKPITALAALSTGTITPATRVRDPGYFQLGGYRWNDWTARGHGAPDLVEAIARSCDVYFYTVGYETGIDAIAAVARQFGLGATSGLTDLPGEARPILASREYKQEAKPNEPWLPGDTVNAAIGQGYNAFTPIQVASYVAALANGGTRWKPYVVADVESPEGQVLWRQEPVRLGTVDLPAEDLAVVKEGMLAVTSYNPGFRQVDSPYGTAYSYFADLPAVSQAYLGRKIQVAAKTGTAETGRRVADGWFVAFAPYDDPEIAVVVMIAQSGGGGVAGGPVARAVIDAYFHLPITPVAPKVVTGTPVLTRQGD